jgi:hypothetical protein
MKLVSFYCDIDGGDFYSNCAKNLIKRCEDLNIEYEIVEENFGDKWIDNVRAKPKFLLKMLNKLDSDFIWLDVDCILDKKIDFNLVSDWMVDFRKDGQPCDYVHLIKNTPSNRQFLNDWINLIGNSNYGSHSCFIKLFKNLKVEPLPGGYFRLKVSDVKKK